MLQFDFILSEKERLAFLEFVFKNECTIVPDRRFEKKKYEVVTDIESYFNYAKDSPLLFFLNKRYSIYPLELESLDTDKGKRYFIMQRYGGPAIDFFSPIIGKGRKI
jgi:hypothetical protein